MRKRLMALIWVVSVVGLFAGNASAAGLNVGGGLHYLHNLADIDENGFQGWDSNSFSLLGSVQFPLGLIKLEGDIEYIFNYAGSDEAMWVPQAYALIGGLIYGGVGVGIGYIDGDWQNDPFYALRGGVNLPLGGMGLDVFASYQFQNDDELKDLTGEDLDALTFGAILRFGM